MIEKKDIAYIIIHSDLWDLLEKAEKENKLIKDKQDAIRFAISIALAIQPDKELPLEIKNNLKRNAGGKNFNSKDIDINGEITLLISELTNDPSKKNYRKMEELANSGLLLIREKYLHDDTFIDWGLVSKDISKT
jgi:hypothetical protein